jgi:hypothetical protein
VLSAAAQTVPSLDDTDRASQPTPALSRRNDRFQASSEIRLIRDHVQDDMFGHWWNSEDGGPYGPYQLLTSPGLGENAARILSVSNCRQAAI